MSASEGAVAPWVFFSMGLFFFLPSEQIVFIGDGASPSPVAIATVGRRGGGSESEKSVVLCLTEGVRCGRQQGLRPQGGAGQPLKLLRKLWTWRLQRYALSFAMLFKKQNKPKSILRMERGTAPGQEALCNAPVSSNLNY